MKSIKAEILRFALVAAALLFAAAAPAQVLLSEDFTGATTSASNGTGNWLFYNGACLTAGTGTNTSPPASTVPGCTTVLSTYYNVANAGGVSQKVADAYLVGGANGYLGGTTAPTSIANQVPDPVGQGALRFTNGSQGGSYGFGERGSIVSTNAYPSNSGINVTFKTVTYHGNGGGNGSTVSGANGKEGADGISFFMMDGCVPLSGATMPAGGCTTNAIYTGAAGNTYSGNFSAIGGTGGSLAYSCSNGNTPYDGLVGAYLGVGIDEYGNFLNGTAVTLSTQSGLGKGITPVASGDNTNTGGGLYANRIGVRGAGSVSWQALTNAYGVNPNNSSLPYYPASLATSCNSGASYDSGACWSCDNAPSGVNTGPYNGSQQCAGTTTTTLCPATDTTYNYTYNRKLAAGSQCAACPVGATYHATTNTGFANGYCTVPSSVQSPTAETYGTGTTCPSGYTYNGNVADATKNCVLNCTSGTYSGTVSANFPYGSCTVTGATVKSNPTGNSSVKSSKTCPTNPTGSFYTYNSSLASAYQCELCPNSTTSSSGGSTTTNTVTYSSTTSTTYPYGYCSTSPAVASQPPAPETYATGSSCPSGYTYNGALDSAHNCVACSSGATYSSKTSSTYPYGSCTVSSSNVAPPAFFSTLTTPTSYSATQVDTAAVNAVQNTCSTGGLYNYSQRNSPVSAGAASLSNSANTAGILDYPALASTILSGVQIANESAVTRGNATPIYYSLTITQDGKLSMSYAVNGSPSYTSVISNQSITASNGPLPAWVRFGFAGSTGGSTNVHEVLCFKAAPAVQSASSAAANQKPAGKVQTGSFAYFASYAQVNSTYVGHLTANALSTDSTGALTIASTPTWDANCVLTGATSTQCATGVAATVQAPTSRNIITWDGSQGQPLEWSSLSADQQAALTVGDPSTAGINAAQNRLSYLRGDRSQEISASSSCPQLASYGASCFRDRSSVLADIIDSSPTWVGAPQSPYTARWVDRLNSSASAAENGGTQSYTQFEVAEQTRTNIVYVGANDGMLHGFRSGANLATGGFDPNAANDGQEVLAYMPGALLSSVSSGGGCPNPVPAPMGATLSVVQNIHGVSPAAGGNAACTAPSLDYSAIQYGHNFSVDATPGTGDLFYNGTWHTWLAGGLGAGGAAIFALDITDPVTTEGSTASAAEGNAAALVMGEWTPDTLTCVNNPTSGTCGSNLGNTYGTPLIRRMHNGKWAIIFGNGYGSSTGDAGIYIMVISGNGTGNAITTYTYYLSTGVGSTTSPNGIAYVTSADLDQDHIVDYLYAGDLRGNVWRFDVTGSTESAWYDPGNPAFKLFTTPTGQPITTQLQIASGPTGAGAQTVMVAFGTGQRNQFTNLSGATYPSYTSGSTTTPYTQSLYGVWDWNMTAWNAKNSSQFAAITATQASSYGAGSYAGVPSLTQTNLTQQVTALGTDAGSGTGEVTVTPSSICWAGSSGCTGSSAKFGWYLNLMNSGEQLVYNPELVQGVFLANTTIPANNSPVSCNIASDTGYTYAVSVLNGQAVSNFFTGTAYSKYHDTQALAEQTNFTGTSFLVTTANGVVWLIAPTTAAGSSSATTGGFGALPGKFPPNSVAQRLTWVELR